MLLNLMKSVLLFLLVSGTAMSSVTITGTRIIFTGDNKDQVVRLNNKSMTTPALVQVWVDDGIKVNDINNKDIPFVVTPPVSRIEPNKGQSIRLIYNGMVLPQDKESVFYFNLLEIPPENASAEGPRLDIAFKTRIKLFYRPASLLKSNIIEQADKLVFEQVSNPQKGTGIKVTNPTVYYSNFSEMKVNIGGTVVKVNSDTADMVAPGSSVEFYGASALSGSISEINCSILNDYGSPTDIKLIKGTGPGFTAVKAK